MDSVNKDEEWTYVTYKKKKKKNQIFTEKILEPKETKNFVNDEDYDLNKFPEPAHYKSKQTFT